MGVQPKPDEDLEPLDFGDSKVRGALEKLFEERFGAQALTELERAVKQGEIKPRATQEETGVDKKTKKKRKGFARLWRSTKLYKIVPGAMSPEQSDVLAGELFARLVESDPNPDEALLQLAGNRAQAITAELQTANASPGRSSANCRCSTARRRGGGVRQALLGRGADGWVADVQRSMLLTEAMEALAVPLLLPTAGEGLGEGVDVPRFFTPTRPPPSRGRSAGQRHCVQGLGIELPRANVWEAVRRW